MSLRSQEELKRRKAIIRRESEVLLEQFQDSLKNLGRYDVIDVGGALTRTLFRKPVQRMGVGIASRLILPVFGVEQASFFSRKKSLPIVRSLLHKGVDVLLDIVSRKR